VDLQSGDIFVIDTSSLISVKEVIKLEKREAVFNVLTNICQQDALVYPPEVFKELEVGVKSGRPDLPFQWAKENKERGCRFGSCHEELRTVMNHPIARLTSDPDQTSDREDADPFVLATALKLESTLLTPVVVTEESRKAPPLVPLTVAAGSLGLPAINLYALLVRLGIWSDDLPV